MMASGPVKMGLGRAQALTRDPGALGSGGSIGASGGSLGPDT